MYTSKGIPTVIDKFAKPITVIREAPASLVAGDWEPGSTTTIAILGVIQPLKPNELYFLAPGIIAEDVRNIWAKSTQIIGGVETPFVLSTQDRLQFPVSTGDIFKVMSNMIWEEGTFFKARIVIVRDQP